ncbi:MAG: RluA family pseudouridine synthase [Muribaculaceae bacterium]|nr:RluA family pseudouridine synthase [Muribaculaceae bacterium]
MASSRSVHRKTPAGIPDRIVARQNRSDLTEGLLTFVAGQFSDTPRNDHKKWLRFGHIMINGVVTTQFDAPVEPGDWVEINLSRPFVVFRNPRMQLIYEDDDVIVVNKGYGLLSVGTGNAKKEATAYNILKDYVKEVDPRQKIFVVHRLDRATSGLMMFAKSPEAQEAMQHNWKNMVLERRYVAVLEGNLRQDEGVIHSYLGETSRFEVYSSDEPGEGLRPATTRYKVLGRGNGYTLVEFSLDTGRKNQIRVHAKELGHPIAGDRKYGAKSSPINRLALHARTLRFAHPVTRKDMRFETPIPAKFLKMTGGAGAPGSSNQ